VHSSRAWRGAAAIAAVAAVSGLVASAASAAVAAGPAAVGITIAAKSAFAPISGNTAVQFLGTPKTADATVSGMVMGIPATTTATVTLLSRPFGAGAFTAGRPVALTLAAGTGSYSFTVAPAVATTYEVQVSESAAASPSPSPSASLSGSASASPSGSPSGSPAPSKSASPAPAPSTSAPTIGNAPVVVATSAAETVYVMGAGAITGSLACARPARPVCHVSVVVSVRVPAATLKFESAKHLFLYSRVLLSRTGEPPAPKLLVLNTTATRSKVRKVTARQFAVTVHFAFRVGRESFHYEIAGCLQDSESRDGIGLPGRHGCGSKTLSAAARYVG
jgi:hypothetical protein